jgi:hypothetical protein
VNLSTELCAAVNVGCMVAGLGLGFWIHIGTWQPGAKFFVAIATFTTFGLWFVTGVVFHVDFVINPFVRTVPFYSCYRFGVMALIPLLYGLFLLITGKARATD